MTKNTVKGIYNVSKTGEFGFVDVEGQEKGYYVHRTNIKDALPGDEVEAEIKIFKGKKEAVIIDVLKRAESVLIGKFNAGKPKGKFSKKSKKKKKGKAPEEITYGFVAIKDQKHKKDIFIPGKYLNNARDGDIVGVKIIGWNDKSPEGKIVKVLGDEGKKDIEVEGFILEAGFGLDFANAVKNEIKNIKDDIEKKDIQNRVDLRNLFTFTIDGEDAKDLDDAISIEKRKNGNYELYVHIADVTHYVKEKSELDNEAIDRGTSVYLVDRVLPMLPKKLSNNLCSLNPHTDKLTLTCEMLIGKDGKLKKFKVYESVINSNFRLTYKEVDDIVFNSKQSGEELMFGGIISEELISKLKETEELRSFIESHKYDQGVLNFDFPETKIILDDDKKPLTIKEYPKYKSNKIIEEFMISANEAVSRLFADIPFLHRIHPEPSSEDIEKLQSILDIFDVKFQLSKFTTKEFSNLLEKIENTEKRSVLEKNILRTLSKAIYSHENEGHFGLGLDFYSHFTSPIRRYPDLQIHRIIKEKVNNKLDKKRIKHYENILKSIADKSSNQERKAEKLEYKVRDYYIVQYYKDKVGEEFDAIIVSVTPKGFFVQLADTAEGFVELVNLIPGEDKKDHFIFNEELFQFEDKINGKKYSLGDNVRVKLEQADEENLRLDFSLLNLEK